MLLPALAQAKDRTQAIKCISNLHQWGIQWTIYTGDNHDSIPTGANPDGAPDKNARSAWLNALRLNPGLRHTFEVCPVATSTNYVNTPKGYGGTTLAFQFPLQGSGGSVGSDQFENGEPGSYGANLWIYNTRVDIPGRAAKP